MFNTVSGKKLALLGFAYKKNTSDTRNSAAIDVCRALLTERASMDSFQLSYTEDDREEWPALASAPLSGDRLDAVADALETRAAASASSFGFSPGSRERR